MQVGRSFVLSESINVINFNEGHLVFLLVEFKPIALFSDLFKLNTSEIQTNEIIKINAMTSFRIFVFISSFSMVGK